MTMEGKSLSPKVKDEQNPTLDPQYVEKMLVGFLTALLAEQKLCIDSNSKLSNKECTIVQ